MGFHEGKPIGLSVGPPVAGTHLEISTRYGSARTNLACQVVPAFFFPIGNHFHTRNLSCAPRTQDRRENIDNSAVKS
jgi:hypothetical protein